MANLAGRFERLVAVIIDGLLGMVATAPGFGIVLISVIRDPEAAEPPPLFYIGLLVLVLGGLAISIYQWIIISKDGQSIGKKIMKVRIVKYPTGEPPGFVYGVLLRVWVNGLLSGLPCGIGLIYFLTDSCFVFREDRRCVHDLIAQTVVIQA